MQGFSILKNVFDNLLATNIVKDVYHSVLMKPLPDGGSKPAAPIKGRYEYIGIDDSKGFVCYCRQNGALEVIKRENVASCNHKYYTVQIPHRLVFYKDNYENNHDDVLSILIKAVIGPAFVNLQKVITDTTAILQAEAPTGRFAFRTNTFYTAIDFFIILRLQTDNCEQEISCKGIQNPYCG